MLIKEVITEGYFTDLVVTVQDVLVRIAAQDVKEIPTEQFRKLLARQGFVTTLDELIAVVDKSGYASSVDKEKIVPKNQLPDSVSTGSDEEEEIDVADAAGEQAMQDINSELPQ